MSDLSDTAKILKRAQAEQKLVASEPQKVITSMEPAVYNLAAPGGQIVKMMEDDAKKDGRSIVAE